MLEEFPDEREGATPTPAPRRHRGRRWLAVLAALALLLVVGVGGFALYLNSKIDRVQHQDLLGAGSGPVAAPKKSLVSGEGTNYLLIGSDALPGETVSRSDVIILAHLTKKKDKVYLIHFPRDLYVSIPGHGKNKINAAYAFGEVPLLVQTLQNMLGIEIDHAGEVGFEGFKRMTDAVGGIRVWAEEPSTEGGVTIVKGWNNLDGAQALTFVRERHELSQGDISRGRRQQAFLKALMIKTLTPKVLLNPVRLSEFVDAATGNLVVDKAMTPELMRSTALSLRGLRGDDIVFVTAPFTGFGTDPVAGSIDLVDAQRMEDLALSLQQDDVAGYLQGR